MIKRKVLFCFVIILAILLCSCGTAYSFKDYRERGFQCVTELDDGGQRYCARLAVSAPDEYGEREIQIELIRPDTLSGIVATVRGGNTVITCDGISIPTENFSRLISRFSVLLAGGDMKPVCNTEINGKKAVFYKAENITGSEEYEFYLDPDTCAPMEIRHKGGTLFVSDFSAF